MRNIKYIVIHHSLTEDNKIVNWSAIRKYHIYNNGWQDIGYHFGIEKINENNDYEILYGRPLSQQGAHTYGINNISIGICVIGNFDNEKPNEIQMKKLITLISDLMIIFKIPISNVIGHRETYVLYKNGIINYNAYLQNIKSCPGYNFSMKNLRNILAKNDGLQIGDEKFLKQLNDYDDFVIKNRKILDK